MTQIPTFIALCSLTVDPIEPDTSDSCCIAFLTVMDCTCRLWAKTNLFPYISFVEQFVKTSSEQYQSHGTKKAVPFCTDTRSERKPFPAIWTADFRSLVVWPKWQSKFTKLKLKLPGSLGYHLIRVPTWPFLTHCHCHTCPGSIRRWWPLVCIFENMSGYWTSFTYKLK